MRCLIRCGLIIRTSFKHMLSCSFQGLYFREKNPAASISELRVFVFFLAALYGIELCCDAHSRDCANDLIIPKTSPFQRV